MENKAAILFDLDGTLVDTAPDLLATLSHVLKRENCPSPPPDAIRPQISNGAWAMLRESLLMAGRPPDDDLLDRLFDDFIDHYSANMAVHSRPFPGLLPQLEALSARRLAMGICTNKREAMARQLLQELGLDHYFKTVLGGDSLPFRKPHPGHLLAALGELGTSPERAVMIGDSASDILAAQAARMPVIALDFGYSSQKLENLNPDALISHYDQLPTVLDTLLQI